MKKISIFLFSFGFLSASESSKPLRVVGEAKRVTTGFILSGCNQLNAHSLPAQSGHMARMVSERAYSAPDEHAGLRRSTQSSNLRRLAEGKAASSDTPNIPIIEVLDDQDSDGWETTSSSSQSPRTLPSVDQVCEEESKAKRSIALVTQPVVNLPALRRAASPVRTSRVRLELSPAVVPLERDLSHEDMLALMVGYTCAADAFGRAPGSGPNSEPSSLPGSPRKIIMVNETIFFSATFFIAASTIYSLYLCPAALMALVSLQVVLMNLFVTKQIMLFGFNATSSDVLGIGAVLGINLLREYCGSSTARTAVIVSFLIVGFYTVISWLLLGYCPSVCDTQQRHFEALLQPMPRILIASLFTYIVIQTLEYKLYDILQKQFKGKYFILRNYGVVLFTQLLDTIMFSFLGLVGIVDNIGEIIMISYAIKAVTIICMTPLLVMCKKILDWSGYATF